MIIEWPHDIDCPACLDGGECDCWVKEAKAYIKRLEAENEAGRMLLRECKEAITHFPIEIRRSWYDPKGDNLIRKIDALLTDKIELMDAVIFEHNELIEAAHYQIERAIAQLTAPLLLENMDLDHYKQVRLAAESVVHQLTAYIEGE